MLLVQPQPQQRLTGCDRLAALAAQLHDRTGLLRVHRDLHLHCLDDQQRIPGRNALARGSLELPDAAGDRRADRDRARGRLDARIERRRERAAISCTRRRVGLYRLGAPALAFGVEGRLLPGLEGADRLRIILQKAAVIAQSQRRWLDIDARFAVGKLDA